MRPRDTADKPVRVDPFFYAPRGLSREEAARYIGVGTTLFDAMVSDGRMPKPKRVNGRVIWDRVRLDTAFADLPGDDETSILDDLLSGKHRSR